MRANTSQPIHEIIATRRSPRSLNPTVAMTNEDLIAILEAARWAPSAFNGQPWCFFVGRKGDALFSKTLESLSPFNQTWAKNSAVLITVAGKTTKDDGSIHADYQFDCGLAVAQMVFEVHHRGFVAHQMSGFDRGQSSQLFGMAPDLTPVVVVAVGAQDLPEKLEGPAAERELAPRVRKELSEIVLAGLPK
jgi:nitroreductase